MDRNRAAILEAGIRVVVCPDCRSGTQPELQADRVRCPVCGAAYPIVDGVLDLMPAGYRGYAGDTEEAAALRDAHNRQVLREDAVRLRSALDRLLPPKGLLLDAGCGTGHLARMIAESHPDATLVATDVSLPMCRLAAKNCRGHRVQVMRTPSSASPPMPLRDSGFDLVLNRLAPLDPAEAFRLLRPGGYGIVSRYIDAHWQEIGEVFGEERRITFPRDLEDKEALVWAGFSEAESHEWRSTRTRSLEEIVTIIRYAPIVRGFDEPADRPLLRELEDLYGEGGGIRLTEGEVLVIGRKGGSTGQAGNSRARRKQI